MTDATIASIVSFSFGILGDFTVSFIISFFFSSVDWLYKLHTVGLTEANLDLDFLDILFLLDYASFLLLNFLFSLYMISGLDISSPVISRSREIDCFGEAITELILDSKSSLEIFAGLVGSGLFAGLLLFNLYLRSGLSVYFIGGSYFLGTDNSPGPLLGTFNGGGLATLLLSGDFDSCYFGEIGVASLSAGA